MALSSFVRRACSSIIPLSIRSRRSDHRQISLFNIENRFSGGGQFLPFVRFSTVPEETPGNSPVHCFVRRASSSSIVRSLGSRRPYQTQISLLGVQFVPCVRFSTVTNISESSNGFVLTTGPECGYISLVKKYQDEIICIEARAYLNVVDYYHFLQHKDDDDHDFDWEDRMDKKYLLSFMQELESRKLDDKVADETIVDVNPFLHLLIAIYQGVKPHKRDKVLRFDVLALTDHPDQMIIRDMSLSFEGITSPYLVELEDFFKKRGIEPNSLFNYFNSKKGEDCCSYGKAERLS